MPPCENEQMSTGQNPYLILLKEAASRTVSGAFTRFLKQEINIVVGTRSRASDSHNRVRDLLIDESDTDDEFPRILRDEDVDFLGGSFARHTKIWPLDDIDIYFPIDGCGLVYTSRGGTLPYTVVTDDASLQNPLLKGGDRWMEGTSVSSKKLIDGFATMLHAHYPSTTRIRRAGEAVNIKTTAFGFDIVPCFSLHPHNPWEFKFYLIPDGNDGWIRTNPRLDNDISSRLQSNNAKSHRPAVKLAKWWNENRFGGKIESYYIELAIMRAVDTLNATGVFHSSVAEATAHAFAAVSAALSNGDLASWISNAPPVEALNLTVAEKLTVAFAAQSAWNAVTKERAGDIAGALSEWADVFGDSFPSE